MESRNEHSYPPASSIKLVGIHRKPFETMLLYLLNTDYTARALGAGNKTIAIITLKRWSSLNLSEGPGRCFIKAHFPSHLPSSSHPAPLPTAACPLLSFKEHQPTLTSTTVAPLTQHCNACQGPGGIKQERKGQLMLIPNTEAAVDGGRE